MCLLQCLCPAHQCRFYHCPEHLSLGIHVHFPVAQHYIHSPPVLSPAMNFVGDFRIQFSIFHQRRSQVGECIHFLYICKYIYLRLLPLLFSIPQLPFECYLLVQHSTMSFANIILRALFLDAMSRHIQYHVNLVGSQ